MTSDTYILKSLQHALQILDLLSKNESMGITEICRILKQSKYSVFRILFTLEAAGYVIKTPEAKYRLSIKFAHYGNAVLERHDILTIARPFLKELSQFHNQASHCAILDHNGRVTFLCRETPNSFFRLASNAGYQMDAYCCATGKMLLSQVPQEELEYFAHKYTYKQLTPSTLTTPQKLLDDIAAIRKRGYSMDLEESEIGLCCIAAPVFDIHNKCVAAISVSGASVYVLQNREAIISSLLDTSRKISRELGGQVV
jgi:DNA-binding IclR family transcriptional regulator